MDDAGSSELGAFHRGERAALEACYREHFEPVAQSLGRLLGPIDRESVIHEVFFRLLTEPAVRKSFAGGSMGGWLRTLARNCALDYLRRQGRSAPLEDAPERAVAPDAVDERIDSERLVARFREVLPPKWASLFELRFLKQLDQRSAARALGISRTTLAYQEMRVRQLLERFVLEGERR